MKRVNEARNTRPMLSLYDGQKGSALLLAIVVVVLLSLIGLSLTMTSISEFTVSTEFEAHEQALIIADAAFNLAKEDLRGSDLSAVLATATAVPKYGEYVEPQAGSYAARNPMPPSEARTVDFSDPPPPNDVRSVAGFMTPAAGTLLGRGRYFARLSDNLDETPIGLPEDPRLDADHQVYLRTMGVHPGMLSQTGSKPGNAVAILEGLLRRDQSFDLTSPLVVYGPDVAATFSGNSFDIVGDSEHPAVTVLNDDPAAGDAQQAYDSMLEAIGSKGRVVGLSGPDGISIVDGTAQVRSSPNSEATNLFNPDFLTSLVQYLAKFADNLYPENTSLSGGGINLGTVDDPQITVVQGDLDLNGSGSGAGFLVVQGAFNYGGAFDYNGVILVVGEGSLWLYGANKDVVGGVYVARIEDDGMGNLTFGVPSIEFSGNSNFIFDSDSLNLAISLLPLKVLSLREITPEMEPNS